MEAAEGGRKCWSPHQNAGLLSPEEVKSIAKCLWALVSVCNLKKFLRPLTVLKTYPQSLLFPILYLYSWLFSPSQLYQSTIFS